jgi:hypothetical protein
MNATNPKNNGHSADVRMQLNVNGHVLPIAQLGPDFLILKNPIYHPPTAAEIAVWVDGHERRWPVWLAEGIKTDQQKTGISRSPGSNGAAV